MLRVGENKDVSKISFYERLKDGTLIERVVTSVHYGAKLVWQSVRSCFGSGKWVNAKPWLNNETWKNN